MIRLKWLRIPRFSRKRVFLALLLLAGVALVLPLALWIAVRVVPFDPQSLEHRATSTIVFDRNGRQLRAYLGNDDRWRVPVTLPEISPWVIKATTAVEDKRFREHPGVDARAICRAMISNIQGKRIISGASTISMQVSAFGDSRDRSITRKLRQAFRALQLEHACSKNQILELYLTNVPYGGNVCGIEAAARRYFGKSAADLSLAEATLLAGVPQSPARLRPDRHYSAALKRREHVIQRMLDEQLITREDRDRTLKQRPAIGSFDALQEAPHFCDLIYSTFRGNPRIRTTLDLDLQHEMERTLRARVKALAPNGVTNGAAVIIANRTGEVLALVGSVDYNSKANNGQVNAATALRSPGSALKPLIYAHAYDCGSLLPGSVLHDVPQQYLDYEPENFDRTFHGLVPADKALAWSLNVPAIQVLNETGLARTLRFMKTSGIGTLQRPPNDYGLSLAIGTCGVRLLDLANAYAMIARGGTMKPVQMVLRSGSLVNRDTPALARSAPVRVMSEPAAYFVTRALADAALRPPEGVDAALAGLENVAWKTGTSSGFRDAWTIAYDANYTVGVWIGNMDGRPSRALVGAQSAAPVALGMMQRLKQGSASDGRLLKRPVGVGRLIVCSETGLPAGDDCPTTVAADCITQARDARSAAWAHNTPARCGVHRRTWVDSESGERLCTRCMDAHKHDERVYAFWPTAVEAWLVANKPGMVLPPAHARDCVSVAKGPRLRITSPRQGDSFVLTSLRDLDAQKVALEAATPASSRRLFWFLDGELVQTADAGASTFLLPSAGRHSLRCVDDSGRSDWITFTIVPE